MKSNTDNLVYYYIALKKRPLQTNNCLETHIIVWKIIEVPFNMPHV